MIYFGTRARVMCLKGEKITPFGRGGGGGGEGVKCLACAHARASFLGFIENKYAQNKMASGFVSRDFCLLLATIVFTFTVYTKAIMKLILDEN